MDYKAAAVSRCLGGSALLLVLLAPLVSTSDALFLALC